MSEQLIVTIIMAAIGALLVLFPRPIAGFYCRYLKELWGVHRGDFFARTLEGAVWVIERVSLGAVYDEATAPKAFRFFGFACLGIAFMKALMLHSPGMAANAP
jgi:hypothetical protein